MHGKKNMKQGHSSQGSVVIEIVSETVVKGIGGIVIKGRGIWLRRNSWHRCRYGNKWNSDNKGDGAYVEIETCCIVIRKDGA